MKWIRPILAIIAAGLLACPLAAQSNKSKSNVKKTATLSPGDSTIQALQEQSVAFFELWSKFWKESQTRAWKASDGKTYAAPDRQNARREIYQHCHAPGFGAAGEAGIKLPGEYAPVRSLSAFSICPSWLLSDNAEYIKGLSVPETENADAAIGSQWIDSIRSTRSRLIESYDRAQRVLPTSNGIAGQRVRFLLDQQLPDSALIIARSCVRDDAFCLLIQGYVESRRGNVRQASVLFDSATTRMSGSERCGWRDVADLVPDSIRANYIAMTCTPRQAFVAKYWWLSDPLYADSTNERRVENDARSVRMILQTALPRDERFFFWKKEYLPDALTKLVLRYGWPTYLAWGGRDLDNSHNGWLQGFKADTQPPYTTYEYSKGRTHTSASLATLYSPFTASDSSWELTDPNPKDRAANWWPDEHMIRARPLVTLPSYQVAMLRRESSILLASAHELSAPMFANLRAGGRATLMVSPAPDTIVRLDTKRVNNATTIRLRGNIPSEPTLFALEISDTLLLGMDARTRIGIQPPTTLRMMKAGEIAVSDPVVLQLAKNETLALEPGEDLLNRMLGSTTISLSNNPRVGVFFESYGVRDGDTVGVSVTLRRRESVSAFRRLGMALNVAGDPNGTVTITWKEPNPAYLTRTVGGTVPIQSRVIALDISALSPGPYDLVTGVKRGTQAEATSMRRVTIVK